MRSRKASVKFVAASLCGSFPLAGKHTSEQMDWGMELCRGAGKARARADSQGGRLFTHVASECGQLL